MSSAREILFGSFGLLLAVCCLVTLCRRREQPAGATPVCHARPVDAPPACSTSIVVNSEDASDWDRPPELVEISSDSDSDADNTPRRFRDPPPPPPEPPHAQPHDKDAGGRIQRRGCNDLLAELARARASSGRVPKKNRKYE